MTKYFVFKKGFAQVNFDDCDYYHDSQAEYCRLTPYIVDLTEDEYQLLSHDNQFGFIEIVTPEEVKVRLAQLLAEVKEQAAKVKAQKEKRAAADAKRKATAAERQRKAEMRELERLKDKYGE